MILSKLKDYKRFIDYTEDLSDGLKYGGAFSAGVQGTAVGIPSKIYDMKDRIIGEFYYEKREVIPLKRIPKNVILGVIANEDAKFMRHNGINLKGIVRALFVNLFSLSYKQGGSTLTQQLSKVLFTEGKKTIKRKIFEVFCAMEIERNYDKEDILAMYLNLIYYGKGAYGIEEASKTYFNKSARYLGLGEAAMLVGLIPNPGYYNPMTHLGRSLFKTRKVLERLVIEKKISVTLAKKALADFIKKWRIELIENHPRGGSSFIGSFSGVSFRVNKAPHFNERLRRKLTRIFDEKTLKESGLKIYTTLDLDKQIVAEKVFKKAILKQRNYHLKQAEKFLQRGMQERAKKEAAKARGINGALVSVNPHNGRIEAYIAGYDFSSQNQLDRVSQIYRQPGSSFKPFIYLAAIEDKKITQASIFEDKKISINGYSPQNYDKVYRGKVTARDALRKSINTVAVQVLYKEGFTRLFNFIEEALDLTVKERSKRFPGNLSLALGTSGISPLEHVRLHSVIANGGKYLIPYGLRYVEDYGGKIIFDNEKEVLRKIREKASRKRDQIISKESSYILSRILMGFFEPGVYGYKLKKRYNIDFTIGGKTGTTSNYVDAWFVGYTPNLVTSLWLGNDGGNISLGRGHSGGSLLSPVWVSYISGIRSFLKKGEFEKPKRGIVYESYCLESGLVPVSEDSCPNQVHNQPFIAGTEPGDYCPLHPAN